jgi:hypothetical protein
LLFLDWFEVGVFGFWILLVRLIIRVGIFGRRGAGFRSLSDKLFKGNVLRRFFSPLDGLGLRADNSTIWDAMAMAMRGI